MKFSQFLVRRRVFVKRVASVCSIGIAVSLAACSSQGFSFSDKGYGRDGRHASIPIPSEPVYGYPDRTGAVDGAYGAPFPSAAADAGDSQLSIQRTSLAPVRTASYDGRGDGAYVGASYAMQPVDGDAAGGSGWHYPAKSAPAQRYAQAAPGYDDYRPYRKPYASSTYEPLGSDYNGDDYVVVEGDTLFGIAKRFGISTIELAELNGILGSTIYAGQRLRISGGSKYTGASRHDNGSGYDDAGPGDDDDGYADDDRKSPPPYYRSGESRRYTSYADYPPSRSAAPAYGDDEDGSRGAYAAKPYRGHADERYARRHDDSAEYRREDHGARHYRKRGDGDDYSYTVRVGDSLYEIARRNGLNHRELADYNDIPLSATLYPGQVLQFPKDRGYEWGRKHDGDDDDRADPSYPRVDDENGYSRRRP
jgi:LysM repeat protein